MIDLLARLLRHLVISLAASMSLFVKNKRRERNTFHVDQRVQIALLYMISLTISMTTRPSPQLPSLSFGQFRNRQINRHTNGIEPIHRPERILSPSDELECRKIYQKLEQLQPNGVCVNLNTLRRALYPPISIPKNKNEQILLLSTFYRQR